MTRKPYLSRRNPRIYPVAVARMTSPQYVERYTLFNYPVTGIRPGPFYYLEKT